MAAKSVAKVFQSLKNQLAQVTGRITDGGEIFLNGEGLTDTVLSTSKGDFQLRFLGENAYSQTFSAEPVVMLDQDQTLQRLTVKRMHPQWIAKRSIREHFRQETEIVGDFINPALPRYQLKGELAFLPYYAYLYIEGVPLTQMMQKKDLYPPELVRTLAPNLILQVLKQLRYLHEQMSVVHGYVGLRSLLLSPEHQMSLIDFGCVYRKDRVIDNDYRWVIDPRYCSPEQARQEPWDEHSDLYQLGVVFYELLTGEIWNTGSTAQEQISFSAELSPQAADFLLPYTTQAISALVAEMLQPDPKARPQSATDCFERLEPISGS